MFDATASTDKQLELMPSSRHGIDPLENAPALQRLLGEFIRARTLGNVAPTRRAMVG